MIPQVYYWNSTEEEFDYGFIEFSPENYPGDVVGWYGITGWASSNCSWADPNGYYLIGYHSDKPVGSRLFFEGRAGVMRPDGRAWAA
jgi:hypothetical protein